MSLKAVEARKEASKRMIDRLNRVREREGLRKVKAMAALNRSTRSYANRLMSADAFFHRYPIPAPRGMRRTGEALGIHTGRQDQIGSTLRRWMRSSAHRSILLDPAMNRVGAGLSKGVFQGRSRSIWVVQVGRR